MGRLAVYRGRVFHPVDTPDDPMKALFENGWSAPAAAYYGTAAEMARRGVATGVGDNYHLPSIDDFRDPLAGAEKGGLAMIDIMEDLVGESELAVVAHSMGGITGLRNVLKSGKIDYFVGEAVAGIQHKNMAKVYLQNSGEMIGDEFVPYIFKTLPRSRYGWNVVREFIALNATDPSRLGRQVWMLGSNPDIAPLLAASHDVGVFNGLMLNDKDRFFHTEDQLEVINRKPGLFDTIRIIEGAKHLHPNTHPVENAAIRIDMINELRQIKLAKGALAASGE
jgi:hypothetical protein